jgi:hypothetical protein
MMRSVSLATLLLCCLFVGNSHAVDLGDGLIHLRQGPYSRSAGPPEPPAALRATALAPDAFGIWIAVYAGPSDATVREAIEAAGGSIVGYVPSHAYLVRARERGAARLRAAESIVRLDRYQPAWRISPDVGRHEFRAPERLLEGDNLLLVLDVFPGEPMASVADAVRATGAEIRSLTDRPHLRRLHVRATPAQLPALARIESLEWIEELGEATLRNDTVRWVIQSNVEGYTPLHDHGLFGEGQIVGHIDAPLQWLSCYFKDPVDSIPGPDHRKLVAYRASGAIYQHGTMTAGVLAGDAEPVVGHTLNRGMAPFARISHTNYFDLQGYGNSPSNLYEFFELAHADGARTHSNSWGDDNYTSYTTWCVDIDKFSRDYEEDLVVFAITNGSSLKTPENAKNVLAVGSTRKPPLQGSVSTGGTGPTWDGRRKPEVYAPGESTVSAGTASCNTATDTGTSYAAPAVAGGAMLVREYLQRGYYSTGRAGDARSLTPTGALVKAIVINSAVDMTGVPDYPSDQEGWGRILLDDALYFPGEARRLWLRDVRHADGLSTGQQRSYSVEVLDSAEPLKITLVFTDRPASHAAAVAPVNDLDLEVDGPDGLFLGNVFDVVAGVSQSGGSADLLNNVERVIVSAPTPGLWTIRVRGADIPLGTQGFAIAANGALRVRALWEIPAPEGPGGDLRSGEDASTFDLAPPSPNPGVAALDLTFAVPAPSPVRIAVYDVQGRLVRVLVDRSVSPGVYPLRWDGRDAAGRAVSPGIYFTRMTAPGVERTVKGLLLR